MARHTYETTAEYHTCDFCGKKLLDGELYGSSLSITIRSGNDIAFEWWSKGDYCYECGDALRKAITDAMPVPERYMKQFQEEDLAKSIEKTLISRQIEVSE